MITRIVKLTIDNKHIVDFRQIFKENHSGISSFEGCKEVKLVFDVNNPNIHFTLSIWENIDAIEKYRQSELFKGIWATVKPWFADKPQAWSTEEF